MPYITREDGEHFVIPSYRDVLSAKQKSTLKKTIGLLSQSYGEYITFQQKGAMQYEVAFSPDQGYLLGESIWSELKKPQEMIYCEAMPNSNEAILVIVKDGSVYLDGSFPLENITEELVSFLTQQNNFAIYTYGDVPISETPEDGKFSFESSSVASFTRLDNPLFPTLPLLKNYKLQLVDIVLKANGIGVLPIKQVASALLLVLIVYGVWSFLMKPKEVVQPVVQAPVVNPYQKFLDALNSAAPDEEIVWVIDVYKLLGTMPGWTASAINWSPPGGVDISVTSNGGRVEELLDWAKQHNMHASILPDGVSLNLQNETTQKRPIPTKIYPLKSVIANLLDKLAIVYPGNHFRVSEMSKLGPARSVDIEVALETMPPLLFGLIGKQLQGLPFILNEMKLTITNGQISGTIKLTGLGSES